ncbi:hypothetical protein [Haloarchaeobius sp. HME9146]|uniref:DUF7289 family protein n=1 Tax=Haloarchaeobius sp. HME9146 TaxID=2978732 RepID=UPI0021BEA8C6|nr:hypothetical protein [Haloarchaeobius sp. HME9146]MCT9095697.1 hypothetical protein [Haloarchaeobius sp. HME9146]
MNGTTRSSRAMSSVIGVALLLGITVLALGALTASIGLAVENGAAAADASRVSDGLDSALRPVEVTGSHVGRIQATDGTLRTVPRTVRLLNDSATVATVEADALVYESGSHRVAFLAGAIVRGDGPGARMARDPPVVASAGGDVLVVGVATLDESAAMSLAGHPVSLRTNVSHDRRQLRADEYRLAVETTTPAAWRDYFEDLGATVTSRDLDGDGTESVVATFPGERTVYLVVHDLSLEVGE